MQRQAETSTGTLRVLFFLPAINYDRIFEGMLRELLRRGHEVRVVIDGKKQKLPHGAGEVLQRLAEEHTDRISWRAERRPHTPRESVASALRCALDYARYLEPDYAEAGALRERARTKVRPALAGIVDLSARSRMGLSAVTGILRALERGLPPPNSLVELIRAEDPDIVMVAPLVSLGSGQADVLRAARAARLPTVYPVASWDNLTNKGLVRDVPTRTIVWNEDQVDEAERLHGLPRDRVHAVGAHAWDHWFAWQPSTDRATFLQRIGLPVGTTTLFLYACSSSFIGADEARFVREWLRRLRAAGGELGDVGVLIRPHPQHTLIWQDVDLGDPRATVWPLDGEVPTDVRRKQNFFDSIYHSRAVIGVNTSVLIESAIVGRPVYTITTDRYTGSQGGTLHFAYLVGAGGLLNTAKTWDDHLEQLRAVCSERETPTERIAPFLMRFVRPLGLDTPAAPLAVDVIERAAGESASATQRPRLAGVARGLVALAQVRAALVSMFGRRESRARSL